MNCDGWKVAITTLMNERLAVGDARGTDIEEALNLAKEKDEMVTHLSKSSGKRQTCRLALPSAGLNIQSLEQCCPVER